MALGNGTSCSILKHLVAETANQANENHRAEPLNWRCAQVIHLRTTSRAHYRAIPAQHSFSGESSCSVVLHPQQPVKPEAHQKRRQEFKTAASVCAAMVASHTL